MRSAPKRAAGGDRPPGRGAAQRRPTDPVAQVQVFPYEALLDPGGKQAFTLKLFDAKGNFIRTAPAS